MSKTWSKEDRHHFEKSEVMQGLETIVLDTIRRADILQEKIAQQTSADVSATTEELKGLTEAAGDAKAAVESVIAGADDGTVDEGHDGHTDYVSDEVAEDGLDYSADQSEVIDDLRDLVTAALSEGNIKLAYRIERTIDEIMEQDTPCL
jgi:hypothetical protein